MNERVEILVNGKTFILDCSGLESYGGKCVVMKPEWMAGEDIWLFQDDDPDNPELYYVKGTEITSIGYSALNVELERRLHFRTHLEGVSKEDFLEELILSAGTFFIEEWKSTLKSKTCADKMEKSLEERDSEFSSGELIFLKRVVREENERLEEKMEEHSLRFHRIITSLFKENTGFTLEEKEVKALIRHWNIYREWGMEELVSDYVFPLKINYAGY